MSINKISQTKQKSIAKNKLKKILMLMSVLIVLLSLFSIVAQAYSVSATIGGPTKVSKNTNFSHQGTVTYKSKILGIPVSSTGYFYIEEPYVPVKVNSVKAISGSWTGATTYVNSSTFAGNSVYRFYRTFTFSGNVTKSVAVRGTGESFTTSSKYYAYCGTGSGHTKDAGVTKQLSIVN